MKRCKVCRKKTGMERRVNNEGIVFCSDECYEEFDDSLNDNDHPYIDDYEALRFEYIHLMQYYEGNLYESCFERTLKSKKVELLELIDSLMSRVFPVLWTGRAGWCFFERVISLFTGFRRIIFCD